MVEPETKIRTQSAETRAKIGAALRARWADPATRQKMVEAHGGARRSSFTEVGPPLGVDEERARQRRDVVALALHLDALRASGARFRDAAVRLP